MYTSSPTRPAKAGSSDCASARLVSGPVATMLTWPGYCRTMRSMNSAACSSRGRTTDGLPSASSGTTSWAW